MNSIISSASKLAFLLLMATVCVTFAWSVYSGRTVLEAKDFMVVVMGAASFYFAYKGSDNNSSNQPPFAGK